MLECKDIRPLLPDHAAGNLDEETAAQVAEHLLLCPICAAALEQLRAEQYRAPMMQPMGLPRTTPPTPVNSAPTPESQLAQTELRPDAEAAPSKAEAAPEEEAAVPGKPGHLSRRGKVILALVLPMAILGTVLALLISRDVFSIRQRVRSADKTWTAVLYQGVEPGAEEGFRIRLWTQGDWERETKFHGCEYRRMLWSPDGRFLALELEDGNGQRSVYVMDTQRQREGNLTAILETYLTRTEGLFGNAFLAGVPACTILQWLPDSSALLIAGEGVVDTDVDPDYGIQYAGSNDFRLTVSPSGLESNMVVNNIAPEQNTVSGYFAYLPETGEIQNVTGFGVTAWDGEDEKGRNEIQRNMEALFLNDYFEELVGWTLVTNYGQKALMQLTVLQQGGALEMLDVYYYMTDSQKQPYLYAQGDSLQGLTRLKSADNLVLITRQQSLPNATVNKAYLLINYEDMT